MAQHGYARDYDEGWDREDDRDRESREREWRATDRNRAFMIGDRQSRDQDSARWTGRGDWQEGRRSFSANRDDHYRSWRDKQMAALDRDYEEYCREREAQFHRDFDDWRSRRRSSPEPLQAGMTQTGLSADPTGITQAENETAPVTANEPDAMADATLGTNTRGRGRR